MKRRIFIKDLSVTAAALPMVTHIPKYNSSLNKLQIGLIGCNGMGWSNVMSLIKNQEVDLVAICDIDSKLLNKRQQDYARTRVNKVEIYTDYRQLLLNPSIDAVVIGTPDHWHCKQMVDAVQAGKHVYVEKPIANTVEECKLMLSAAEKTKKIVQVGQWQRSGSHYQKAIEFVRSGKLGQIRLVKVWAYQAWMKPIPILPDGPSPEGVDYLSWLGPAPLRPFNPNRFHFNFRWFWDYAGGLMTDWGVHEIDIALYAMQAKEPKTITATGGKLAYKDDASETPDTLQTVFEYENFTMLWEHATGIDGGPYSRSEGIAFIGNNGTLVVNRQGYEVMVEKEVINWSASGDPKMEKIESFQKPQELSYLDMHTRNFIEAIKKNDIGVLNTPIKSGAIAAINAQMGNISYKTGQKLFWDSEKQRFHKNKEANKLLNARYHNGWTLPKF